MEGDDKGCLAGKQDTWGLPLDRCLLGDCREILPTLPAGSVQCCVTSPPYFGLRDYGTGVWEGGDGGCDHRHETEHQKQGATSARIGCSNTEEQRNENFRAVCAKCGARRIDAQIGLEETPELYVETMVQVFRLVRKVLADDGTLWLNLGDCYARNGGELGGGNRDLLHMEGKQRRMLSIPSGTGLKPKDLVGIPWRVAFALQADGWFLRSDIIWHKINPMPESCTDRPTKSHEYLFLLSKKANYYYDAEAIRENNLREPHARQGIHQALKGPMDRNGHSQYDAAEQERVWGAGGGRNRRTVWTIPSQPYSEAHFATFPEKLVEPCIMAGSRPGDVVLDPFLGSGTTAQVAQHLGRRWIGIELNGNYEQMQRQRTAQMGMPLS